MDVSNRKCVVKFESQNLVFFGGFKRLYEEEHLCDVTVTVKGDGQDVGEFKCHRHILSMFCSLFNEQFSEMKTFGNIEVTWWNVSSKAAKKIFDYIYKGSAQLTQSDMAEMVTACKVLGVDLFTLDLASSEVITSLTTNVLHMNWGIYFVNSFKSLYAQQKHFDVTIQIDGRELHAHRLVLSVVSDCFNEMFCLCSTDVPVIMPLNNMKYVTYNTLRDLLDFIYTGEVKVDNMKAFMLAGEELQIRGLRPMDRREIDSNKSTNRLLHIRARYNNAVDIPIVIIDEMPMEEQNGTTMDTT